MGEVFTEANWVSRRSKLIAQIEIERAHHADLALKVELGRAKAGTLTASRDTITNLQHRLDAVDAAYSRSRVKRAEGRAEERARKIIDQASEAQQMLAERAHLAKRVEEAADALRQAWEDYKGASHDIAEKVMPWLSQQNDQFAINHALITLTEIRFIGASLKGVGISDDSPSQNDLMSRLTFTSAAEQNAYKAADVIRRLLTKFDTKAGD